MALCAGVCAAALLVPAGAAGAESVGPPAITNLSATAITESSATLAAQVAPRGSETTYTFWLQCEKAPVADPPCFAPGPPFDVWGRIGATTGEPTVSVSAGGLKPGYTYGYWVTASNSSGSTESSHRTFQTAPSEVCGAGCPYESEVPKWYETLSEEESAHTLREYEAKHARELEALHAQEAARQHAGEVAAANEEAELRRRGEEEARERAATGVWPADDTLTLTSPRAAIARLKCLGATACHGRLTLTASALGHETHGTHFVFLGSVSFTLVGDEERSIRITLTAAGRRLVRLEHRHCHGTLTTLMLTPRRESRHAIVSLAPAPHV